MNLTHLIKRPIITEKTLRLAGDHKYSFEVATTAIKPQIKAAVEKFFHVKVLSVKTLNISGKSRRVRGKRSTFNAPDWKKAIVELMSNQTIDLFETDEENKHEPKAKVKSEGGFTQRLKKLTGRQSRPSKATESIAQQITSKTKGDK